MGLDKTLLSIARFKTRRLVARCRAALRQSRRLSDDTRNNLNLHICNLESVMRHDTARQQRIARKAAKSELRWALRSSPREIGITMVWAVLIAIGLRAFVIGNFSIPSGSMMPTIKVGDKIFVNRLAYGIRIPFTKIQILRWNQPRRGDIVVFNFPGDPEIKRNRKSVGSDLIKRVVGVAGDRVRIANNRLILNDRALKATFLGTGTCRDLPRKIQDACGQPDRCNYYSSSFGQSKFQFQSRVDSRQCIPNIAQFPAQIHDQRFVGKREITVPTGFVFVMGDNRDNSSDSRFWGMVPLNYIKGRATLVWFSKDPTGGWFGGYRWHRTLSALL